MSSTAYSKTYQALTNSQETDLRNKLDNHRVYAIQNFTVAIANARTQAINYQSLQKSLQDLSDSIVEYILRQINDRVSGLPLHLSTSAAASDTSNLAGALFATRSNMFSFDVYPPDFKRCGKVYLKILTGHQWLDDYSGRFAGLLILDSDGHSQGRPVGTEGMMEMEWGAGSGSSGDLFEGSGQEWMPEDQGISMGSGSGSGDGMVGLWTGSDYENHPIGLYPEEMSISREQERVWEGEGWGIEEGFEGL